PPAAAPPSRAATSPSAAVPSCTPAPLARRAASVLVVGLPGVTTADAPLARQVVDLGVGGVFLSEPNVRTAAQVTALTAGLRARAGHPLLVSTDEESGRVAVTRKVVGAGPAPRTLAKTRTQEQVRTFARGLGERLARLGVDLDLAPVADLDAGPSRGIVGDRSFGSDPRSTAGYALAFAAGLSDADVAPAVKHFPGQGRSQTDTHKASGVVDASVEELRTTDLVPFTEAVDAGAPVVMLNHLQYDALDRDLPASLSPKAYALLRSLGFQGVAMTDSVGMGAVNLRWDFPEAAVRAVVAGADAVLATDGGQAQRMRDALVAAVREGRLPEGRLDEAASRVAALAGADPVALTCRRASTSSVRLPPGPVS
ncbi:MAG: glycoside hydrolase family 3 domain protein, partial [Frankiales bacterium]|nr:glycoside hydrolase family 3 domain protein [Frankiales bacterium]